MNKFNILNQSIIVRKLILSALFLLILIPLASATPSLTIISPENTTYNETKIQVIFYSNETVNITKIISGGIHPEFPSVEKIDNIRFYNRTVYLNGGTWNLTIIASNENGTVIESRIFTIGKFETEVPVSACGNLEVYNEYYTLTTDITDFPDTVCFSILNHHIFFYGGDHLVDGVMAVFQTAIRVASGYIGSDISTFKLTDWWWSITVGSGSNFTTIRGVTAKNCKYGVHFRVYNYEATVDSRVIDKNILMCDYSLGFEVDTNGYFYNNYFYNNIFNASISNVHIISAPIGVNYWNTTKTLGTNVVGGKYLGGNYWTNPWGTGFSDTCPDADGDNICDVTYTVTTDNIDYLPLAKVVPKPDLVPFDLYPVDRTIYYKVKNIGTAPSGKFVNQLIVDGVVVAHDTIYGLSAGETRESYFPNYLWTCTGTSDTVKVVVDINNEVDETREDNNEYTETWTCGFDFRITAEPSSATVIQGQNATSYIKVELLTGSPEVVALSCENLPAGVTCYFSPSSGTPTFTSILTIATSTTTPVGTYTITIKGTSSNLVKTIPFTLTVSPPIKFVVTKIITPNPPIYVDRTYRFYICVKNMGTEERRVRIGFTAFADVTGLTNNTVYTTYPSYSWKKMCNGYVPLFKDICYVSAYTLDRDGNKWPDIRNITPGGEICVDIDYKFASESPANFDVGDKISFLSGIWDDETGEFYSAYALVDIFTLEEEPLYACPIHLVASHKVARLGDVVTYTAYIHNTKTTWNFTIYLGIGKWNATHGVEYPEPQPVLMPPCNLPCYKDAYGETFLSLVIPQDFTAPVTRKMKIPEYFPKGLPIDVAVGVYRTKVLEEKAKTLEGKKPVCFVYFKDVTNISTEPSIVETLGESASRGIDSTLEITSRVFGLKDTNITKNFIWGLISIIVVVGLGIVIRSPIVVGISLIVVLMAGTFIGWFPLWISIILIIIAGFIITRIIGKEVF
jgi:hypothetical protein